MIKSRTRKWKVDVREDLAAELETRIWDDALGRPAYGQRTRIMNSLLEVWVRAQQENGGEITASSIINIPPRV